VAGHIMLKIIACNAFALMSSGGIFLIFYFISLIILVMLFFLEFFVALIQAYVFCLLTCLYLNDVLNLH
jgi:F-type H+-transporting ATPase subunit a